MYKYILDKKIQRYYKRSSREKRYLNLKNFRTILVLFDTSNYEAADGFIENLKKLNKEITAYAFKNKLDLYDYSETPYKIITAKDAGSLFDNKIEEIARELKNQQFDAIFDLTLDKNIPLEYLLINAKASIKAGLKKGDRPRYDFSIASLPETQDSDHQLKELGKQIVYYLHTIKSE